MATKKSATTEQTAPVDGNAVADIVNTENPEEHTCFSIPLQFIAEPSKFRMKEVQGVGAAVTYYRLAEVEL